ncbi:MAG: ScyD/ScyE family protein [Acidimicrobiia bacterium]
MKRPRLNRRRVGLVSIALSLAPGACSGSGDEGEAPPGPPVVQVVARGLLNPVGLAAHPDGGILIAEEGTGDDDLSAGVSMLTTDGRLGRIVSGLPSGRDAGDLSGAPLVGISPDGSLGYVGHFGAGSLLTFPTDGLEPETEANPALTPEGLGAAMVPLNEVRVVNPFDIAFDTDAVPVVADASQNGVATENPDGTTRFFHRFGELEDPQADFRKIDAVPTGIARVGTEFYVTLTGGCPYPRGSGRLVAIDQERNERVVAAGLNMPIDVAEGPDGVIWLLEFAVFEQGASCFTGEGYRPGTGRLSRIGSQGDVQEVLDGLDFPGAVLPIPDGSLYVSEIFSGRILHLSWPEEPGR